MLFLLGLGVSEAKNFAVNPKAQSGKFQHQVDIALNWNKTKTTKYYAVDCPVKDARTGERELEPILFQPPHESLKSEVDSCPEILESFGERISKGPWIRAWEENPVVAKASPAERQKILGLAVYMDGAAHGKRDELLIFTIRILNSHRRNLCFAFQKSLLCVCGCGGWCTMSYCYSVVYWSLVALANGVYPDACHDGSALDADRQLLAGKPLGFKGVVVDVNGDWTEFAVRWGFPTWQSGFRPCMMCSANHDQMLNPAHVLTEHDADAYDQACRACERWVAVTDEMQKSALKLNLIDDSTRKGVVLKADANDMVPRLIKGDRLEPSSSLPNVHAFPFMPVPFVCKFWRIPRNAKSIVHHRNILIAKELGISTRTFSGDYLHSGHLGIHPVWMTHALWSMFSIDAFESRSTRQEDHLRHNALMLQTLVSRWYPAYERGLSEKSRAGMTRVSIITPSMLGKADLSSVLGFKAAENKHFLPFVLQLIRNHREKLLEISTLDYDALEQSGQALLDFQMILDAQPRLLEDTVCRQLELLMDNHVVLAHRAGIRMFPKHHMVYSFLLSILLHSSQSHFALPNPCMLLHPTQPFCK